MYLTLTLILLGIIIFIVAHSMKKYDAKDKNVLLDAGPSERLTKQEIKLRYQLLLMIALSFVVYIGVHLFVEGWRFDLLFSVEFTFSVVFMIGAPIVISIIPAGIYWLNNHHMPPWLPTLIWVIWLITAIMTTVGQLAIGFAN